MYSIHTSIDEYLSSTPNSEVWHMNIGVFIDIFVEYCDLNNGYSKITIEIYGPSLYDSYDYYFRYNNLYFSYIKISAEIYGIYKYRQYFNSNGELIRNLEDDGSGNKNINSAANLDMLHFAQDILLNDKN